MFTKANLWKAAFVVIGAALGVALAGYQTGRSVQTAQPVSDTAEPAT